MALQKNVISEPTGATLSYHEVSMVVITPGLASISVLSYPDKAAKDSGKRPSDSMTVRVFNADSVMAKPVMDWAQDQVLADPRFAGAVVL